MKKIKLLSVLSLLLCAVIVLSSCASLNIFSNTRDVTALIDATPLDETVHTYTQGSLIEFHSYEYSKNYGDLLLFIQAVPISSGSTVNSQHKKIYTVYNLKTQQVVFSKEVNGNYETLDVNFGHLNLTGYENCYYFYTVLTTNGTENVETFDTVLYDANGRELAKAEGNYTIQKGGDLIGLDGTLFRVTEDGKLESAFTLPAYSTFPTVTHKCGELYYNVQLSKTLNQITVYDKNLNFVSRYTFPTYAEHPIATVLKNGKVFIQYVYQVAAGFDNEYDFLLDGKTPYNIDTYLFDPDTSKTKELRGDEYVLIDTVSLYDSKNVTQFWDVCDLDGLGVIGTAVKIEKGRGAVLSETSSNFVPTVVSVNENGKIIEYEDFNGERAGNIYRCSEHRWVIQTTENQYLIGIEEDKVLVLGNISNATVIGRFVLAKNQIYDLDLKMIYDLDENSMTYVGNINNVLVLQDEDSDVYLYDGTGEPKKISYNPCEDISFEYQTKIFGDCVIVTAPEEFVEGSDTCYRFKLKFYNENGECFYSIDTSRNITLSFSLSNVKMVADTDGAMLFQFNTDLYVISE